ncbi:OsmC family protein [Jatrophihabitans telluris]|uniref:OsmC family protein n=1 Tax=Jatrophihabitans telluris TaxID=2038343 RepID=A0ABY4QWH1_9ACTN|nr:OsmC family protein [Jatrophihabitans telluris]UQX88023.1 OsmC family protein [Jatrophihabitans telluris]
MPGRTHDYRLSVTWTGNRGAGTADIRGYGRDHAVSAEGKPGLLGSADRAFRGDPSRWNPEELLLAALSQCHMLAYLSVAALAGVVVTDYSDEATGRMVEAAGNSGRFEWAELHPVVTVADESMIEAAGHLHAEARRQCFIANSVNFEVRHVPVTRAR